MDDLKAIDLTQRVVFGFLSIPVTVVVLNALVQLFGGVATNPVVAGLQRGADAVTPEVLTTMFEDQSLVQTLLITLAFYGIIALVLTGLFSLLRMSAEAAASSRRREKPKAGPPTPS